MKKFSVICGLALAMLAAGCAKDATTDINPIVKTTLSVSLDETRTYLGSAVDGVSPILWSEGDAVAVNGASVAVPAKYVGQAAAAFEGVTAAEKYSVFYPASLLDETSYDKNVYTIPVVQPFVEGSFAPNTSILVGYSENESVSLKNVYGYLKITLTNAANVNKVYVSATANEAISGTFKVDYENATVTPLAGESIIRVMGVQATSGTATVIVAIPAGEYAQGFTVKALDKNHYSMTKTVGKSAGVEIVRAQLYALPSLVYEASDVEEVEITTAEELDDFLISLESEDYSQWVNANGEVVLGNDIDLADYPITSVTVPFMGVFNGQGYALKNWEISAPLFNELGATGVVKNLSIDASCTNAFDKTMLTGDIGIIAGLCRGQLIGVENNADLSFENPVATGHIYIGALAGRTKGANVAFKNCVNNGNVVLLSVHTEYIAEGEEESSWYQIHAGGIVGRYTCEADASAIPMENCINNGEVKVAFDDKGSNSAFGGLIGSTNYSGTEGSAPTENVAGSVINCVNNGNVTCIRNGQSSGSYTNIGGIAGYFCGAINGGINYGKITYTTGQDPTISGCTGANVGGVAGQVIWMAQNCKNYGEVDADISVSNPGSVWNKQLAGGTKGNFVGGVFGLCGALANALCITNCDNHGPVNSTAVMIYSGGSTFFVGGVCGGIQGKSSYCNNYGALDITSAVHGTYIGGVVGRTLVTDAEANYLYNYAPMTVDVNYTGLTNGTQGESFIGGVSGRVNGPILNCETGVNATMTTRSNSFVYVAGISGYGQAIDNCTYRNDINHTMYTESLEGTAYTATKLRLGGMAGQVLTGKEVTNCEGTKDVAINVTTLGSTDLYIGGIGGYINTAVKGSTFGGDITINGSGTGKHWISGIAALAKVEVSDCETTADASLTINSTCTGAHYIAGIVGDTNAADCAVKDCDNNMTMSLGLGKCQTYVGGIVAYGKTASTYGVTNCDNYATITVTRHTTNANSYIGGIAGQITNTMPVDNCHNSGKVEVQSASGFCMGGIGGAVKGTISNSSNSGNIVGSAMADLASNSCVGGINGFGQANLTGCTNSGAIVGNDGDAAAGGLVGKHGNTNQTYNDCTVGGSVTAKIAGIFCGWNNASTAKGQIGTTTACKVKTSFTLNGVQVTEDDLTNLEKLWGKTTTEGLSVIGTEGAVLVD